MNRACLLLVFGAACTRSETSKPEAKGSPPAAPNFELLCDSSDAKASSMLYCMRHDTRNGDVKRVLWDHLPATQGSTEAAVGPPGRYQLACHATRNEASSDLFCVRVNTETGEMMLINLGKTGTLPAGVPSHEHGPGQPQH